MPFTVVCLLALALFVPARSAGSPAEEVVVFAAASLSDALLEIGRTYERAGGGKVVFNFAASNDLARQIEAGAPAQVFLSANLDQVSRLERVGRVPRGSAIPFLRNALVVVVPRQSPVRSLAGARDLLGFERLALADPAGVPAGVYARTWLERKKLWPQLASRIVPTLDVRAALAAVASGNLPAGIVYATDAVASDRVRVVYRVPVQETPDLLYVAVPVQDDGKASPAASRFLRFLQGAGARAVFQRHGFVER